MKHALSLIRLFLATLLFSFMMVSLMPSVHAEGDAKLGEEVFNKKCKTCHTIEKDGKHKFGPNLYGAFGSIAGTKEGYNYSKGMKEYGKMWCEDNLNRFLEDPKKEVPGTKMSLRLKKAEDRKNVIAYLKENSDNASECEK